ncbi:MAG TPA: hypothetical protein PKN41_09595 [Bacteroidales bacterium]|nr:hypothetical protein [Bacteroidales bacterium]
MKISTRTLLVISAVTLLLVVPANIFQPVSFATSTADSWQAMPSAYPGYLFRFSVIFSGLLLTIISLIIFIISLFFSKHSASDKLANLSMFVFVFVLGWMAIPYWTNGLYHVFCCGTSSLFDPKSLLPMTIIGEAWRIPILVLYPLFMGYLLFSLIRFIVLVVRRKNPGIINVVILLFNLLIIAVFFFVPHYFYWLLD